MRWSISSSDWPIFPKMRMPVVASMLLLLRNLRARTMQPWPNEERKQWCRETGNDGAVWTLFRYGLITFRYCPALPRPAFTHLCSPELEDNARVDIFLRLTKWSRKARAVCRKDVASCEKWARCSLNAALAERRYGVMVSVKQWTMSLYEHFLDVARIDVARYSNDNFI